MWNPQSNRPLLRVVGPFSVYCMPCYNMRVTRTISQRKLRNDTARVIEAVVNGETFVITRNGVAVAELQPLRTSRRDLVPKAELVALATAGPDIDLERFRSDLDHVTDEGL